MYRHAVDFRCLADVTILPPEEPQEVLVLWSDPALVKHGFDVANDRHQFASETQQDSGKTVHEVRTLVYRVVERQSTVLGRAVEHDSTLRGVAPFEHWMVRQVPLS